MCLWISGRRLGTISLFFFFQAEDGIRDLYVTGVQTCALPICKQRDVGTQHFARFESHIQFVVDSLCSTYAFAEEKMDSEVLKHVTQQLRHFAIHFAQQAVPWLN